MTKCVTDFIWYVQNNLEKCIERVIFKASLWHYKSALDSFVLDRSILVLFCAFITLLADKVEKTPFKQSLNKTKQSLFEKQSCKVLQAPCSRNKQNTKWPWKSTGQVVCNSVMVKFKVLYSGIIHSTNS